MGSGCCGRPGRTRGHERPGPRPGEARGRRSRSRSVPPPGNGRSSGRRAPSRRFYGRGDLLAFPLLSSILQPVDPNERYRSRRETRRQQIRRRRLTAAAILLALIGAGVVGGVVATHFKRHKAPARASASSPKPRAFAPAGVPLAEKVGAAHRYYDPRNVAAKVHAAGLYLIGRVVTFEDPFLSAGDPALAIRRADGSRWVSNAGLGWTNPYDRHVWRYNVSVATAAAKAGFDEIQFDYVRFPSDGNLSRIRY